MSCLGDEIYLGGVFLLVVGLKCVVTEGRDSWWCVLHFVIVLMGIVLGVVDFFGWKKPLISEELLVSWVFSSLMQNFMYSTFLLIQSHINMMDLCGHSSSRIENGSWSWGQRISCLE